ncbi:FecR family protein [Sinomicrobium soli]|uniref:FecR family protein n=1 Tax=Sinomicrobium sp. N-1-3-6 TaxID=2219864 RepID=UPI000DCAE641|nr:FecR family protein [Sinomicrobium sp. N-1-3-6]RAV30460.1 hypothetical protein DN748_02850 [Sinomicrobium sp. N-1-3-6]
MTEKQFKILLNKFLAGKATRKEIRLINKLERFQLDKNKNEVFKNEAEKQRLKTEIYSSVNPGVTRPARRWLRLAASVVILLGIGYTVLLTSGRKTITVNNPSKNPKSIVLADGSEVILNHNSKLTYNRQAFPVKDRNVELSGEAFFKVARNPRKPFIIKTGALTTRVLGTQFNIRESDTSVKVTVNEGKVRVYNKKDTLQITVNQQAVYNTVSGNLRENTVNAQLFSLWQMETMVLNNITVSELSVVLSEIYGIPVCFKDPGLKNIPMAITLKKDEKITEIINRVNLINDVKLILTKDNMIEIIPVKQP